MGSRTKFEEIHESTISKFSKFGQNFRNDLSDFLNDPNQNMGQATIHRYQIEAIFSVKRMLDSDPSTVTEPSLIVAPTGAGKSGMIVMLPYILQSNKVLIITPSALISNQLAEAFGCRQDKKNCFLVESKICTNAQIVGSFLEDVKVIGSSREAIEQAMGNLVIVNAQKFGGRSRATLSMKYRNDVTIRNVRSFFAQFDTLIVDEAHHYTSNTWQQIVEEFKREVEGVRKKIVFLTATPFKFIKGRKVHVVGRERTAFTIVKEMCIGESIREILFDINRTEDKDYLNDIYGFLDEQQTMEDRFENQAMILVKGRKEVYKVVEELNEAFGENFAVGICGESERIAEGLRNFTEGMYRVAVTCKVGLEGYDNTRVTLCVILRRVVTGKIMFSQFVGRCMRMRRELGEIDGREVRDRNKGMVVSYEIYEQEKLMKEYQGLDDVIAEEDPENEDE